MTELATYKRNTPPGTPLGLTEELRRVEAALRDLQDYAPRPTAREPSKLRDGMIRLARDPWRPVVGQTTDRWVYFDGNTATWEYL